MLRIIVSFLEVADNSHSLLTFPYGFSLLYLPFQKSFIVERLLKSSLSLRMSRMFPDSINVYYIGLIKFYLY
jgi:hypothetical protein